MKKLLVLFLLLASPALAQQTHYDQSRTNQVSVGTTATLILPSRANRTQVTIVQHGTTQVFLGIAGVTITTGSLLPGVAGSSYTIPGGSALYGVVGTGTDTVSFLESW